MNGRSAGQTRIPAILVFIIKNRRRFINRDFQRFCPKTDFPGPCLRGFPRPRVSPRQTVNPVLDTIRDTKAKEKVTDGPALHSDQGVQYLSQEYFNLTQAYRFFPSVSGRGNPYDNALAENFFSILKTECIHLTKLRTFAEAERVMDEYIYFCSHVRLRSKTKLTPAVFRNQFCA